MHHNQTRETRIVTKTIKQVAIAIFFIVEITIAQSSKDSVTLTPISRIDVGFGSVNSSCQVIAQDGMGNQFVAGNADPEGAGVAKFSPSGALLWKTMWAYSTTEVIRHQMVYNPSDNSVVVETLEEYGAHPELLTKFDGNDGHQVWQIKLSAIALEVWQGYILALQENSSSGTLFVISGVDGSTQSNFTIDGYLDASPMIKVSSDTLYLFSNPFFAKFLLPSGKLVWQVPMSDFTKYPLRTFGVPDVEGNVYVSACDLTNSTTAFTAFAFAKYSSDGKKIYAHEWYGWADTSLAGGVSRLNTINSVYGMAFNKPLNKITLFGGTQKAGTVGYQGNFSSTYLALVNPENGDTVETSKWDDDAGASDTLVGTTWNDGYFNSENQLVLLGYGCFGNTTTLAVDYLDNFIKTFVIDVIATGVHSDPAVATGFGLSQNYPNPFNPTTRIRFEVSTGSFVTLKVYNTLGQEVQTLVEGEVEPGTHEVSFVATSLPSGTYFYRLTTSNGQTETKGMLLLK